MQSLTKEKISKRMKLVKSKWTKPEICIHNYLKSIKIKHKMHPKMFGNPDALILNKKIVIFYNGCFWHKCKKCGWDDLSKLNDYWKEKLINNFMRDKRNHRILKNRGWGIIKIWGHDFKNNKYKEVLIKKLK